MQPQWNDYSADNTQKNKGLGFGLDEQRVLFELIQSQGTVFCHFDMFFWTWYQWEFQMCTNDT